MKKKSTPSGTSLFLLEMILTLFFLALACSICIQLYAGAAANQKKSREYNKIRELTVTMGEILENTSGRPEDFLSVLPGGSIQDSCFDYYFDQKLKPCSKESYVYQMHYEALCLTPLKSGKLTFTDHNGKLLYEITLEFPTLSEDLA